MTKLESLGIKRLEGIHYYVHDLERSRKFYVDKLDFAETWRSSPELEQKGRVELISVEKDSSPLAKYRAQTGFQFTTLVNPHSGLADQLSMLDAMARHDLQVCAAASFMGDVLPEPTAKLMSST